jgi:hypothetical protein
VPGRYDNDIFPLSENSIIIIILVFFKGLFNDGEALPVSFGGGAALVRSDLLRAKAGDPHVPAPFQHQLHVLHFDGGGLPTAGNN